MEHVDAAGEIATGTMLARAVEPRSGEAAQGDANACLNCGADLPGRYCGACGQPRHVHRTIGSLFHDLLHGVLHFEGKIWRTLPMLVWSPGELTRRYIAGERARFVSPLALFLFTAFLMFAIVPNLPLVPNIPFGDARSGVDGARQLVTDQIAFLEKNRADQIARGVDAAKVDQVLSDLRGDQQELQRTRDQLSRFGPTLQFGDWVVTGEEKDPNWISTRWRTVKQNPDLLFTKLKNSAYKFSWALVPLSLPLIWLLFARRRDVGMYDHAIFGIYSLSFMSLLAIAAALLISAGAMSAAIVAMVLLPPLHLFRQVKGAYQLGWWSALWRTAALLVITVTALLAWIVLLAILGSG